MQLMYIVSKNNVDVRHSIAKIDRSWQDTGVVVIENNIKGFDITRN